MQNKPREIIDIPLVDLSVSKLNVRRYGGKDIATLARSIETRGLLYPLLVRALDSEPAKGRTKAPAHYEVVAGKRRLAALKRLARDAAPCIVIDASENADAIEISLAENTERVAMCPLDEYQAFAALLKEGRSEDEIAHTVNQRPTLTPLTNAILTPPFQRPG